MAVDVGSAVGYLDLDISRFLAGLKSAQSEADTASKNIATKIGGHLRSAGKSLASVGSTLTKSITVPIAGLGTAAIKTTSNFESAMSKVSAISGATGGDLDKLNKKVTEEQFERVKVKLENELNIKQKRYNELNNNINDIINEESRNKMINEYITKFLSMKELNRELIISLIDRIEIFEDKTINIKVCFNK